MRRVTVALSALTLLGTVPALAAPRPTPPPVFASYTSPPGLGDSAGEPTLGWDPRTGAVLFQALERTLKVTGFDGRGNATWKDVSPLIPGLYTFDPIIETDKQTGRTWTSQLDLYCSRMAYTDDAGSNWTQVPLGCGLGAAWDHQTVGVGPFRDGVLTPVGSYPNAVYYCAQTGATAQCSTSLDGGLTFLPARPAYTAADCTTAFGHLKAAPDGTIYLPPFECGGQAGLARSDDNGLTWSVHLVDGSATNGDAMHPSVDAGADGTVYYAWGGVLTGQLGGPPYAAMSRDRGESWSKPVRLGTEHGIVQSRFVTTVAGDGDRAAVAFLGAKVPGDSSAPAYTGEWRAYVAFTYDRGKTWKTVDATPKQPVQLGAICTSGALCLADRNLLDFIDVVIDGRGNVLVAIADGCPPTKACTRATRDSKAVILRQESGRGLLRKYDRR